MQSGIYFLEKLSVVLEPRLELLANMPNDLMFALKNVNSTAWLDLPDDKCLFAGIKETSTLFLQFGTKSKKVYNYLCITYINKTCLKYSYILI